MSTLGVVTIAALSMAPVAGFDAQANVIAGSGDPAQGAQAQIPAFDVASIKAHEPEGMMMRAVFRLTPDGVSITGVPLSGLLVTAFGVPDDRNAATSIYSTNPAFGNAHPGGRALYNGGFATFLDNSATDARPYNVSGVQAAKSTYTHMTDVVTLGGPLRIPHLLPYGPNFFLAYIWTRDNTAAIETGLVPTIAERMGNLAGLDNAQGQPITVFNPATGQPYLSNMVPVSQQAASLLNLYPQPNIAGSTTYNYQAPVLNDTHQDSLQSHFTKTIGRKDTFDGQFSFESTRAGSVNLFGFVDKTDTLGLHGNIHWLHRLSTRIFFYSGYDFSRLRTQVTTEFENRVNISENAGIGGNDQDPADWGPPSLNFTSGFAALRDTNSEFNRNQTNAFSAHALYYHGRHDVTVGGDYLREDYNYLEQQDPRGTFTFTGEATAGSAGGVSSAGSDLADFLIGIPDTSGIAYGNADKYFREPVYDAYFTDDWRVLPILTINAGMRWDYQAPMTELFGRLVNLDIASGFSAVAPVEGSDPVGSITGTLYPSSLLRPDRKIFEPRIGISWRPIPASSVVVRAGYGIYPDTSVYLGIVTGLAQQYPLSKSLSVQNSAACPLTLANGFVSCPGFTQDTFAIDPNFHIGYAQIWNLEVQRDLPFAMQVTAHLSWDQGHARAAGDLPQQLSHRRGQSLPGLPFGVRLRNVERKLDTRGGTGPVAAPADEWFCRVADVHLLEVDRRRCVFGWNRPRDSECCGRGAVDPERAERGAVNGVINKLRDRLSGIGDDRPELARPEGRAVALEFR